MNSVDPTVLGAMVFGAACMLAGVNFIGIGAEPRNLVSRTLAIFYALVGIVELFIIVPIYYVANPGGSAVMSNFLGVVFGLFGVTWLLLAFTTFLGGDLKPLAYFFIFEEALLLFYAYACIKLGLVDFSVLLVIVVIALPFAYPALVKGNAAAAKITGIGFFLVGLVAFYITIKGLMPILG